MYIFIYIYILIHTNACIHANTSTHIHVHISIAGVEKLVYQNGVLKAPPLFIKNITAPRSMCVSPNSKVLFWGGAAPPLYIRSREL